MFGLFDNSKPTNAEAGDEEMDATNFFAEFDQFLDDEIDDSPSPEAVQAKSAYDAHTNTFPSISSIDDDHTTVVTPTTQTHFRSPLANGSKPPHHDDPHHHIANGSNTRGEPRNPNQPDDVRYRPVMHCHTATSFTDHPHTHCASTLSDHHRYPPPKLQNCNLMLFRDDRPTAIPPALPTLTTDPPECLKCTNPLRMTWTNWKTI